MSWKSSTLKAAEELAERAWHGSEITLHGAAGGNFAFRLWHPKDTRWSKNYPSAYAAHKDALPWVRSLIEAEVQEIEKKVGLLRGDQEHLRNLIEVPKVAPESQT